MPEINVKINIGERTYPLTVPAAQEENLRRAAKLLNDKMREYIEQYAVRDKQDVLGMTALFFATELVNSLGAVRDGDGTLSAKLAELEALLG